jgi:hypothetical protein
MIKPFTNIPLITSQFPSPEELLLSLTNAPRAVREIVARLWLTEGLPSAFLRSPAIYEDLRGWLGSRLDVHPKEITLIGSARIGYSLAPPPDFGRPFHSGSDLDLSIVSDNLFQRVTSEFTNFSSEVQSGVVVPRTPRERILWGENIAFGVRNIPKGFFDPNKLPNFSRYHVAQQISQSMWALMRRLEVTDGAPEVSRASIRVYRDWKSFVDRVSFNLLAALNPA